MTTQTKSPAPVSTQTTQVVDLVRDAYLAHEGTSHIAFADYLDGPNVVWTVGEYRLTASDELDEDTGRRCGYTWYIDVCDGDIWDEILEGGSDNEDDTRALITAFVAVTESDDVNIEVLLP